MNDTKVTNNNGYDPGWIARLRAAASEADALRATVAEQARQIEAARVVIVRCSAYIGSIDHGENTKSYMMCDAWLAANAPTPAPEAEHTAPVVRYCEHCQRDTVTLDGACLWCNHVKPSPEAEQERTA